MIKNQVKVFGLAGVISFFSVFAGLFSGGNDSGASGAVVKYGKQISKKENKQKKFSEDDPYGNVELFETYRSEIKFALAFVENFFEYAYNDGTGVWTYGYGTTRKYGANGKIEGRVKKGEKTTIKQADIYEGRYLTYDVLEDIKKSIKVPIDKNTLIATCVFRYCIGGPAFRNSQYLKALNSGASKKELSRRLTGFRKQPGVLNRCYFFAALLEDKITFDDLLDLRAEGCYNLELNEVCKCVSKKDKKGKVTWTPVADKDNFATWSFDNMDKKLEIAKKPRRVPLNTGDGKRKQVECKLVKDIVMPYIWQEVSTRKKTEKVADFDKARAELFAKIKKDNAERPSKKQSQKTNRTNSL